jgi:NAD(P)-dependent dehydrogenase (short-subunit alcohol dehydrogenase family)
MGEARREASAIVTGGASGIGRALAEELGGRGLHVVVADRQRELADEVAEGIRGRGGAAAAAPLDVRDREAFRRLAAETAARGPIAYLFNNAGIGASGEISEYEAADWDEVIDVNLRGVTHGILAVYPHMIAQGSGHIVNTASMAGLVPSPALGSYTATKHAVVGLSQCLRVEARRHGVRVSVLCPGVIRTPLLSGGRYGRVRADFDVETAAAHSERMRPMEPAELARRTLRAVDRDRAIIIEPRWWRLFWVLYRLSPGLFERMARRMLEQVRRDVARASGAGAGR